MWNHTMRILYFLLLLLGRTSSSTLSLRQLQQSYVPAGLQSGPNSQSNFAAASVYNPADNTILITGTSYGNFGSQGGGDDDSSNGGCFLAVAQLPTDEQGTLEWIHTEKLTQPNVPEGCNAILLHKNNRVWLAGHSEKGGLLDALTVAGRSEETTQYGMLMDVQINNNQFNVIGGRILQDSQVIYPVALDQTPDHQSLFVMSMETENTSRNEQYIGVQVDPTRFFRYGSIYSMKVTQYQTQDADYDPKQLQRTLSQGWINAFNNKAEVHVAGILRLSDTHLVVAGSTSGWGEGFGPQPDNNVTDDFDGFVTKLDATTGLLFQDGAPSTRIASPNGQDDFVSGICHSPKDIQHVYITGSTRGELSSNDDKTTAPNTSIQAFVMKLKVDTLEAVWTKQLGAQSNVKDATKVRGVSCAVAPDGEVVYFGGVVEQDAVLAESGTTESYGGNDIFVARVATDTGIVEGVRQIGTRGDDEMAMRGGLTTDQQGNAVVVGNTYGSMYRKRSHDEQAVEYSDVFVFTISRYNGDIKIPYDHPEFKESTTKKGTGGEKDTPVEAPSNSENSNNKKWAGLTALLVLLVFGVLLVGCFVAQRGAHREIHTDRSHVLDYVQKFNVEDIDLKHSATGGWHCSYANDLANGVDKNISETSEDGGNGLLSPRRAASSSYDPLTAPLTNSSILEDSLFMDDEPSVGLDGRTSSSGYDGLVDAYNSTWNSRTNGPSGSSQSKRGETWGGDII